MFPLDDVIMNLYDAPLLPFPRRRYLPCICPSRDCFLIQPSHRRHNIHQKCQVPFLFSLFFFVTRILSRPIREAVRVILSLTVWYCERIQAVDREWSFCGKNVIICDSSFFYTPPNEVRGGILDSACLSVCPSVRLSVCPLTFSCPPCSIYSSGWILSIFGTNDQ